MEKRKVTGHIAYQLYLYQYIDNPKGKAVNLLLEQRSTKAMMLNNVKYNIGLLDIRFNRKIYQPGEIEAELDFVPESGQHQVPTAKEVNDLLLRRQVEMSVVELEYDSAGQRTGTIPVCVAKNYYVYGITPRLNRQTDGSLRMTVKLAIYSMDKLMTLDKYSKAYVKKKLGSGILEAESLAFGYQEGQIMVDKDHMRQLKYGQQMVVKRPTGSVAVMIPSEFIHPYLVQYNETFYDFMARTANRSGEFFYFEDGKLTLGLPESKELYELDNFQTVTYQNLSPSSLQVEDYARDSMKDAEGAPGDTNYQPVKKNAAGFPNDAFPGRASFNAEVNNDEYFFPLYVGKFTSFKREMGYVESGGDIATQQVFSVLESAASATDGVGGFGAALGTNAFTNHKGGYDATKETNEAGNIKYISKYYGTEHGNGLETVLFGTVKPDGWTTLRYYQDVRRYEEEQQKQIICIDMGPGFVALKLGEQIKVAGLDQTFVIVQIEQEAGVSGQRMKICAIPLAEIKNSAGTTEQKPFPPVLPVSPIRKSGPQTAFITDNNDPKYQGRVRIVYPWQSLDTPERKALDDAEKVLMEVQQKYNLLDDQYKKIYYARQSWWHSICDEKRLQEEKDKIDDEIEEVNKSIKATERDINLNNEQNKILQKEDHLLSRLYGQKRLAVAKDIEAEVKALTDNEIATLEKTTVQTDDDEVRLRNVKYIINRLSQTAALLKDETQQADVPVTLSEVTSEFEKKMTALQKDIDKMTAEKEASEKYKAQLEKKRASLDLNEEEFEKTLEKVDEEEYKKIKEDLAEAEKTVTAAKQNVEAKAKDFSSNLDKIATPWIRVAQPMATEGGGTFFKPMVGDEVLVNFDGDNIERPYVVGSLYSKNTLVPDERINRNVGPNLHANASIAIVSPNGHGITFKDPSKGDGFFTSVYPGLRVFNEYAGKAGLNIPLPKTKDVTGGIRIGDRYGLYSIDMSSDKRSVSITSSMGTVKLNAFTGISISAPNGDIKIEGKNVSIKAGNNLSLMSGTNIKKDVSSSTAKGFFLSKVDMALGMAGSKPVEMFVAPFLDASLFRTVLEVFLKPIEGTMLIKSKRYLKLEAGSGKTVISKDRYKGWDPNKLQDMATSQQFFKTMMETVNDMNDRLNKFKVLYRPLWTDAAQKRYAYISMAQQFYKDDHLKDYLKKAMDIPTSEEWSDARKIPLDDIKKMELKKSALWFRDSAAVKNAKDKEAKKKAKEEDKNLAIDEFAKRTEPVLNEFMKAIHALHKHFDSFKQIYDNLDDHAGFIAKSMKGAFDYAVSLGFTPYDLNSIDEDSKPDKTFTEGIRTFKRQVAGVFMIMVSTHPDFKDKNYIKVDYLPDEMAAKKVEDTYLWNKFLGEMEEKAKHPLLQTVVDSLKDNFNDARDADGWKNLFGEKEIWNDRKGGQILFSDDENSTVNLDGGAMSMEQQSQSYNLSKLKQLLAGLD